MPAVIEYLAITTRRADRERSRPDGYASARWTTTAGHVAYRATPTVNTTADPVAGLSHSARNQAHPAPYSNSGMPSVRRPSPRTNPAIMSDHPPDRRATPPNVVDRASENPAPEPATVSVNRPSITPTANRPS
jgi:hypothetical protein